MCPGKAGYNSGCYPVAKFPMGTPNRACSVHRSTKYHYQPNALVGISAEFCQGGKDLPPPPPPPPPPLIQFQLVRGVTVSGQKCFSLKMRGTLLRGPGAAPLEMFLTRIRNQIGAIWIWSKKTKDFLTRFLDTVIKTTTEIPGGRRGQGAYLTLSPPQ